MGGGLRMNAIIDFLNTIFWGYVLIYGLLAVGVFFTIRLRFQQILRFGEMFRVVISAPETDREGISPFQALCTSLASRVGTGNIAGVAVANIGRAWRDLLDVDGRPRRHGNRLLGVDPRPALQGP